MRYKTDEELTKVLDDIIVADNFQVGYVTAGLVFDLKETKRLANQHHDAWVDAQSEVDRLNNLCQAYRDLVDAMDRGSVPNIRYCRTAVAELEA